MSQSSSHSEPQPETPQAGIYQHNSGNSSGGQQANQGNNNNLYQDNSQNTFNVAIHFDLLSNIQVFIFLSTILIFWTFLGFSGCFAFLPYVQVIALLWACLNGNLSSEIDSLQKKLLLEKINARSIEDLTQLEFQIRLCLGLLKHGEVNNAEAHEVLAKTINALKQKKRELQNRIEPQQSKKYKRLTKIQDSFESFVLSDIERELIEIESVLNNVSLLIRINHPSETIIQDAIEIVHQEIRRETKKINPSTTRVLYNIKFLLHDILERDISTLGESDLNELNRKITEEKHNLSINLSKALDENQIAREEIRKYLEHIDNLNFTINTYEYDVSKANKERDSYFEANKNKQIEINKLISELRRADEKISELQTQKSKLKERNSYLNKEVSQKQNCINQLNNKLKKYSKIKIREGDYIGILSNRKSKYHFDRKCDDWKMLVGEYMLNLDISREIASSDNPTLFIEAGLKECEKCKNKKRTEQEEN